MPELTRRWLSFVSNESGTTATEYALIAVICSVAIIAGLYGTRDGVNDQLGSAASGLQGAAN